MKIKSLSKLVCSLLAMILFVNPVLAMAGDIADALFSSDVSTETTTTCHDDLNSQKTDKQPPMQNINVDCCDDICLCDDASCHGFSLVFQTANSAIFSTLQISHFGLSQYASFIIIPKSPPPIA